jgi:hypothetical protein
VIEAKPKKKGRVAFGGGGGPNFPGGMRPPNMPPGGVGRPTIPGPMRPGFGGGGPSAGGTNPNNPGPGGVGRRNNPPRGTGTGADPSQARQLEDEEGDDEEQTGIYIRQHRRLLQFKVKLVLEDKELRRMERITGLVLAGMRGELDLYTSTTHLHRLGGALRQLAQKDQRFPQAALFRQPGRERAGYTWEPDKRISWMAQLLPYLGHEALHKEIDPKQSWDDKQNLFVARTLVPEFQDPSYPKTSQYVNYPGVLLDVATTHFVAVGGIGEDAAADSDQDPEAAKRLGAFGYNRSTPLSSLERGASQTAVVIQVPPEYAGPWMAGGGSTVRGIPENDSVKPFICAEYNGQKGTFVLMADGSVRFVSSKISPEAFRAMFTIKGKAALKDDEWQSVPEGGMKARPRPDAAKPPNKK